MKDNAIGRIFTDAFLGSVNGKVVLGLLVTLITLAAWLLRHRSPAKDFVEALRNSRKLSRVRRAFPTYLESYRDQLGKYVFRAQHPWIPRSHTLDQLLVRPQIGSEAGIEDFEQYLHEYLNSNERHGVLALTGPAGSGKSVSLGLAMEVAWNIKQGSEHGPTGRMSRYFPMLFSFVDLRAKGFSNIQSCLLASLTLRHFAGDESNREEICKLFLEDMLREGRVLVLADGLDELNSTEQQAGLRSLMEFASAKAIPCIFTSREGALASHMEYLSSQKFKQLRLLEFGRGTVERFIRKWPFAACTQAEALLGRIEDAPALFRLCSNPQLATIICFLHSEHDCRDLITRPRILDECARSLLTRDKRRDPLLAPPYKERLLAQLAFEQATSEVETFNMSEVDILELIGRFLFAQNQQNVKSSDALKELLEDPGLVYNAGESGGNGGIRFVHKAFVEYFAAKHLAKMKDGASEMLKLWRVDKVKWEEVLVIYVGLRESKGDVINSAIRESDMRLLFRLLASNSHLPFAVAEQLIRGVLQDGDEKPSKDLIESLGQFLVSIYPFQSPDATKYARLCESLLIDWFDRYGSSEDRWIREAVLRILLVTKSNQAVQLLVSNLGEINLARILPFLSTQARVQVREGLLPQLSEDSSTMRWIEALSVAQLPGELAATFSALNDPELQKQCAVALTSLSCLDGFWGHIETLRLVHVPDRDDLRRAQERWGWWQAEPCTPNGRRAAVVLCRYLSDHMRDGGTIPFEPLRPNESHRWIFYLANSLAWEDFYAKKASKHSMKRREVKLAGMICQSTPHLLRSVWRSGAKRNRLNPDSLSFEGLRMVAGLCPIVLFLWAILRSILGHSNKLCDWTVFGAMLFGMTAAWLRVLLQDKARRSGLSPLDFVVSTVLGPVAILREVRLSLLSKRQDDHFAMVFGVGLATAYAFAAISATGICFALFALGSCLDAVLSVNRIVGLCPILTRQGHGLNQFLCSGSPDAVQ